MAEGNRKGEKKWFNTILKGRYGALIMITEQGKERKAELKRK
jgi:hypothetical protein